MSNSLMKQFKCVSQREDKIIQSGTLREKNLLFLELSESTKGTSYVFYNAIYICQDDI